jgi:Lrp/AsnC family leucine-responsive transcriptional regulator
MSNYRADASDRKILRALQKDGRLTNVALADRIGMSPSPCLRRVRQLEESGVIEKYVALLDYKKLGFGIVAYVEVKVPQVAGKKIVEEFEQAVLKEESIVGCYIMAGQFDFLLKVVARDMEQYAALAQQVLLRLPGVQDLRSCFVMNALKDSTELPL